MRVVGVDGCPGGWIAMVFDVSRRELVPRVYIGPRAFQELLADYPDAACITVDIPIGLAEGMPRPPDVEARRVLGPRRNSVFPAPDPRLLDAANYGEAVMRSRSLLNKGISQQAFAIYAKIAEVNDAMTPDLQRRVIEVHPEVSFWALAGQRPMEHPKKTAAGFAERRTLLASAFEGINIPDRTAAARLARPAGADDVLDATVAAWTAHRLAEGRAGRLPTNPTTDTRGLRMEIVY